MKVSLKRPKEKFNKNCAYHIYIGGKKLTELRNGEEKVLEIPGRLENEALTARINWCGSNKIALSNLEEDRIIKVTGNEFLNWRMPIAGSIIPLLGLVIFSGNDQPLKGVGVGIILLFMAGLIGTLTIWRRKWLNIQIEQHQ
jgi:hypothetical protein